MEFDMGELKRLRQLELDREAIVREKCITELEAKIAKKIQQQERACFEQLKDQYVLYGEFNHGGKCSLGEFGYLKLAHMEQTKLRIESRFKGIKCVDGEFVAIDCYITKERFMKQ